jgi:hypothetical protein
VLGALILIHSLLVRVPVAESDLPVYAPLRYSLSIDPSYVIPIEDHVDSGAVISVEKMYEVPASFTISKKIFLKPSMYRRNSPADFQYCHLPNNLAVNLLMPIIAVSIIIVNAEKL